ncbi:MAG: ornithine cyclodeaminase family protein, partial [Burkholderia sp.]|nr:ornithine cyclodeaminase family protein [Burkholderia sp.]
VDSAQAAAAGASIVLAAARSRGELPTLYADWLAPRATLVSIGSTIPQQREIDVSVVDWADLIICDTLDEVLEDTGDMLAAQQAGIDPRSKSHSLGALMRGEIDALRAEARRPMFKSVGGGLQDIVIAEMILEKALEAGLAQPLPIDFDTKL